MNSWLPAAVFVLTLLSAIGLYFTPNCRSNDQSLIIGSMWVAGCEPH